MNTLEIGILYTVATVLIMFSGVPIAFAVGIVALIFMFIFMPFSQVLIVAESIYSELNNFTLLTIPLFIFMGAAIGKSRAGSDLYNSLNKWLYKVPGGLGVANTLACSIFAAMCGSSPATCAAIGSSGIPEMRKRGYSNALATGIIGAGGTLGILIPPSLTMILYGLATEQSIGKLFMAGVGPGILLTLLFSIWVVIKFLLEKKSKVADIANNQTPIVENYSLREKLATLPRLFPFLLLILFIMYALYGGVATPSEVAGIGAIGAFLLVVVVYKTWRWRDLKPIFAGTAKESSMIMLIIGTSFLFTYVMSYLHITQAVAEWLVSLNLSKWQFIFWINILLLFLGCLLPPVAIILMVMPIILPPMKALNIDLIWFSAILTVNMEMGLITPPMGLNLFVINGVAPDIPFKDIMKGIAPFLIIMVIGIILLCIFPEIVMWLPNKYKGV